jgi:hypothetical protein
MLGKRSRCWNCTVFVAEESRLRVSLSTAHARLVNLVRGPLVRMSQDSHDETITGLLLVGPLGALPGLSRRVTVSFLDPVIRPDQVALGMRWHAAGPGGRLAPALDADLVLTADGPDVTVLRVEGVYRPPLGALGARLDELVLKRVAAATIRSFVNRVADAIVNPPGPPHAGPQEVSPHPWPPPEPESQ